MKKNHRRKGYNRWAVTITIWTFFLAVVFSVASQWLLHNVQSIIISFLLLTVIILIGIVFDIIGIAAAAADEKPLHAKAAKRVYGARNAINLTRRAGQVASFCNDVVGDISGIVSGTVAALIIVQIAVPGSSLNETYLSIALTALVAGFTVGGKAFGKNVALEKSEDIMMFVSVVITKIEDVFHITFFSRGKGKRK